LVKDEFFAFCGKISSPPRHQNTKIIITKGFALCLGGLISGLSGLGVNANYGSSGS
jgi:hypothetical protein